MEKSARCTIQLSLQPTANDVAVSLLVSVRLMLTGKNIMIFSKISKYRKYQKYHDIFDIFDIFQELKICNKLYNNGCNTLMQYLMTISYQSFVPYVGNTAFHIVSIVKWLSLDIIDVASCLGRRGMSFWFTTNCCIGHHNTRQSLVRKFCKLRYKVCFITSSVISANIWDSWVQSFKTKPHHN